MNEDYDKFYFCPWCFTKYPKTDLDCDYVCPICGEKIPIKKEIET